LRANQITQILECHANLKPFLTFLDEAASLKQSNKIKRFGGITLTTPNHLKIRLIPIKQNS
jgi:glutaredoxin-related protein